jgi:hypothetical protein
MPCITALPEAGEAASLVVALAPQAVAHCRGGGPLACPLAATSGGIIVRNWASGCAPMHASLSISRQTRRAALVLASYDAPGSRIKQPPVRQIEFCRADYLALIEIDR